MENIMKQHLRHVKKHAANILCSNVIYFAKSACSAKSGHASETHHGAHQLRRRLKSGT